MPHGQFPARERFWRCARDREQHRARGAGSATLRSNPGQRVVLAATRPECPGLPGGGDGAVDLPRVGRRALGIGISVMSARRADWRIAAARGVMRAAEAKLESGSR